MKKKILIIGNGANSYALAKKLSEKHEIFITPITDTLKEFAESVDVRENNPNELLEFVMENQIDMTIPLSIRAIEAGITELFNTHNQSIFAPSAKSAEIILNKAQAKKILYKLRIPTPKFGIFEKENMANDYLRNQKIPFVIKSNDTNSATVLTNLKCAKTIISSILIEKNNKVIIEDYIYGSPFSFYSITDGYKALPLGSSLNYKHSLDGEGGQLTSGMGSCTPNYKLSIDDEYYLMDNIIYPTLDYMEINQMPYLGILGINGIKTDEGKIYVFGWNSFLQDSDAAGILENLDEDLYTLFESCIVGSFSDEIDVINQKNQYSVSLVLANQNKENKENSISGLDSIDENSLVTFYPNISKNKYLEYESCYGQNLVLTSFAPTISSASNKVYSDAQNIDFTGKYYRKDICRISEFT